MAHRGRGEGVCVVSGWGVVLLQKPKYSKRKEEREARW
jgi:hypothetical protein